MTIKYGMVETGSIIKCSYIVHELVQYYLRVEGDKMKIIINPITSIKNKCKN